MMTSKGEKGILTLYSDVQATSVRWLWYPFIAVGKITLLQGDPGDGKSTMMMHLIAELSKGGTLPDGKTIGMPQRSIYQCSEDGISDTIKPRLEKCGADCRNVAFINEETYSGLTLDDERIRQAIIEFRPRLVVIDPIQAYLGSDSDLQIAGRARRLMQRLGMWASMYDCAIVLIGHLNKKEGTKGLYRSLGSIDVVAAARSVLQVERDAEKSDIRIVRHGVHLGVPAALKDARLVLGEHGQQLCRRFRLRLGADESDRHPVHFRDRRVSVSTELAPVKQLIHRVTDMRKAEHAYFIHILNGHFREKSVHISLLLRQTGVGKRPFLYHSS